MAFNDDNTAWFDVLSLSKSYHGIVVIDWFVKGKSIFQTFNTFVHQFPIDSVRSVEITLFINVLNFRFDLIFWLVDFFVDRISSRSSPKISTYWLVKMN